MNTFRAVLAATAFVSAAFISAAQAEDSGVYFSPEIAYVLPTDGDLDDSYFIGGRVGWPVEDNMSLELEAGWMELGWDAGDTFDNTDIDTIPVLVNLRYDFTSGEDMDWYGYVGGGWAFNNLDVDADDVDVDDSFAWQIGGGMDFAVGDNIDMFLDVRYLWNRANVEAPAALLAFTKDDVVLNSILFTTGVKF